VLNFPDGRTDWASGGVRSEAFLNEFERSLIEIPSLPTVPAIAQRLLELIDDEASGLEELAEVIALDPALSAKIVRVINSSMYAMSREITSVREAALYLGTCNVCSIALSFSFVSSFGSPRRDAEMERLWHTSLMTSLVARRLALEVGGWDSEEAFLVGLLCDCGALLMYAELPEYGELIRRFYRGELDLLEAERTAFASDHTRIGALLLERWAFPQRHCSLIAQHHDSPSDGDPKVIMRQRILNSAWLCSRALTIPGYVNQTAALSQQLVDTFDIPPTNAATRSCSARRTPRSSTSPWASTARCEFSRERSVAAAASTTSWRSWNSPSCTTGRPV
jgi:HD-like signal output (HDOD) protein